MKKTLCETCMHGLVREVEAYLEDPKLDQNLNRCLLDQAFVDVVTKCNRYRKAVRKVTYHDPEFEEYEKKVEAIAKEINIDDSQGKG